MFKSCLTAVALLSFTMLTGCKPGGGANPAMPPAATSPAPPAAVAPTKPAGVVDVMTGKANMDAGRRAAQKIRAVSRQEQQDLDKAMAP